MKDSTTGREQILKIQFPYTPILLSCFGGECGQVAEIWAIQSSESALHSSFGELLFMTLSASVPGSFLF